MEVKKTINLGSGHKIELGNATWDKNKKSVRNRYPTAKGGFSPRSSSELPIEDIELLVTSCIENDYLEKSMIQTIRKSCDKKLKKNNVNFIEYFINHLEAFGLVLILISFGWQTFENHANSIIKNSDLYDIHEKLDKTWGIIADQYSKDNETTTTVYSNYENSVKTWKYWNELKRHKKSVEGQAQISSEIRGFLYIIGSVLILIPKFQDKKTIPNKELS
jgi:hypothetical protein